MAEEKVGSSPQNRADFITKREKNGKDGRTQKRVMETKRMRCERFKEQ